MRSPKSKGTLDVHKPPRLVWNVAGQLGRTHVLHSFQHSATCHMRLKSWGMRQNHPRLTSMLSPKVPNVQTISHTCSHTCTLPNTHARHRLPAFRVSCRQQTRCSDTDHHQPSRSTRHLRQLCCPPPLPSLGLLLGAVSTPQLQHSAHQAAVWQRSGLMLACMCRSGRCSAVSGR